MEADTRLIESMLGWFPMFKIAILELKCPFGLFKRDLSKGVGGKLWGFHLAYCACAQCAFALKVG